MNIPVTDYDSPPTVFNNCDRFSQFREEKIKDK